MNSGVDCSFCRFWTCTLVLRLKVQNLYCFVCSLVLFKIFCNLQRLWYRNFFPPVSPSFRSAVFTIYRCVVWELAVVWWIQIIRLTYCQWSPKSVYLLRYQGALKAQDFLLNISPLGILHENWSDVFEDGRVELPDKTIRIIVLLSLIHI